MTHKVGFSRLDVVLPPDVHGIGVVHPKEGGVFLDDRDGVVLRKILNLRHHGQTKISQRRNEVVVPKES